MRLADAHIHIFGGGYHGRLGASPVGGDELAFYERLRSSYGIERALVVGYEGEERYTGNNREILALAHDRSWMVPVAYLAVHAAPTVDELRSWRSRGAAGFSIYLPAEQDSSSLSEWSAQTLEEFSRQRAILSFNATPAALAHGHDVISALDGARIIFSHLGLPGRFASPPTATSARERLQPLLSLASCPNVSVKLSGLYAISEPAHGFPHAAAQPFVDILLDAFGPSRLMWGSDFSPALDHVSFAQAADAHALSSCTPSEIQDVMGLNLLRVLEESAGPG